jgi:transposase
MKRNDLSLALVAFDQDSTIVAVVELSLNTWLVSGQVPGVMRRPLKKQPADADRLLALLHRWRDEAVKAGHPSAASRWPSRPTATASGWRGGCARVASRPM